MGGGVLTVWKFPLGEAAVDARGALTLVMPRNAEVLHVGVQEQEGEKPKTRVVIWALVDPDATEEERHFLLIATGQAVPDEARHLGTFFMGPYVWHLFEWHE